MARRSELFGHVGRARYVLVRKVEVFPAIESAPQQQPQKQAFPTVVWVNSNTLPLEVTPVQSIQTPPCGDHEEEEEFNPFAFFSGGFEFPHPGWKEGEKDWTF